MKKYVFSIMEYNSQLQRRKLKYMTYKMKQNNKN